MGLLFVGSLTRAIRIAHKVGQKYKYFDPNKRFIRKYVPPGYRRNVEIITDIAMGGGLLYEAYNIIKDELPAKKRPFSPSRTFGEKRNYMEQSKSRRFQYGGYNAKRCYPTRRR